MHCGAGYEGFGINGTCNECPVGYYKTSVGMGPCSPCQSGHTTAHTGATSPQDCFNGGWHWTPKVVINSGTVCCRNDSRRHHQWPQMAVWLLASLHFLAIIKANSNSCCRIISKNDHRNIYTYITPFSFVSCLCSWFHTLPKFCFSFFSLEWLVSERGCLY